MRQKGLQPVVKSEGAGSAVEAMSAPGNAVRSEIRTTPRPATTTSRATVAPAHSVRFHVPTQVTQPTLLPPTLLQEGQTGSSTSMIRLQSA